MSIVPEKLSSRGEVRGAVASQFWDQSVQSPISIDGLVRTLPCEPPPLPQSATSGLARSQQMVAAQALDIPFTPAYVADEGGVVLDRVYARVGGQKWWANVSGRARLQRMLKQHKDGAGGKEVFQNLSNFGLGTRTRHRFGRNTTLNTCLEAPNMQTAFDTAERRFGKRRPGSASVRRAQSPPSAEPASESAINNPVFSPVPQGPTETHAEAAGPSHGLDSQGAAASSSATAAPGRGGQAPGADAAAASEDSSSKTAACIGTAAGCPTGPPFKGRAWLKHQIAGHDLMGSIAWNEQALDSAAAYCRVPLSSSVDLASHIRQDGIQYRVTANPTEAQENRPKPPRSSLHFQGAVAVEGEAMLWKPSPSNSLWDSRRLPSLPDMGAAQNRSSSFEYESSSAGKAQDPAAAQGEAAKAKAPTALQGTSSETASNAAAPVEAKETEDALPETVPRRHHAEDFSIPIDWSISIDDEGHATVDEGPGRIMAGSETKQGKASSQHSALPQTPAGKDKKQDKGPIRGGGAGVKGDAEEAIAAIKSARELLGEGPRFKDVDGTAINAGLRKASERLERANKGINRLTRELERGGLQRRLNGGETPRTGHQRSPYSPWLAQPYLKVIAAVGCLARIPLPQGALRPIRVKRSAQPAPAGQRLPQSLSGRPGSGGLGRLRSLSVNTRNAAERLPRFGRELWAPYLADTLLRVFASCGISGQIGNFTRPFLDFTQASVRLDLGLTSPQAQWLARGGSSLSCANLQHISEDISDAGNGSSMLGSPYKHRAFALEGRGIWHALSLSASQQVYGPLRAKADLRVALESPQPSVPAEEAGRATLEGAWKAIRTLRATQLESIFGLDCVLPNSQGAARIAAWWSPSRKEAMMELRLF